MNSKQWLNRGYKLNCEIEQLERAKAKMRDRLTSATPSYSPSGGAASPDPHKFDLLVEYQSEIDNRIDELIEVEREIRTAILRIEDTKLRTLLLARYVNFETFEQIAVDMSYDWRWIMRLHKRALAEVDELLNTPY